MRKSTLYVIFAFVMASVFVSCHQSHKKVLNHVYKLAEFTPDSSLAILNRIDKSKLSEEDMAKYALVYYMAQDKSGLDVDNDSLIRIAYNWYEKHQEDSLYALCLNYMGKYCLLVDSLEQAKACLEKSYYISDSLHNQEVKCLVLSKLIEIEERLAPYKALNYAKTLVKMYDEIPDVTIHNEVAAHVQLCENFWYVDSLQRALEEGKIAQKIARRSGNSVLMSAVAQDLSNIFEDLGEKDSCLFYARQAYDLQHGKIFSCQLALASAYMAVDSLKQVLEILKSSSPITAEDRYSVFYFQSQAAMKSLDYETAKVCNDSAYQCLEEMYQTALRDKTSYYTSLLRKESEKAKIQGEAKMQRCVFALIIFLGFLIISFVLYVYKSYRKQSLVRLEHEREIYCQKQQMLKKLHQKELSHKEVQLSIMRNYLQKQIDVVERLGSYASNANKRIILSEDDWKEIEVFLDSVEDLFVTRLKQQHPNLSKSDLRLMMLLRLKLSQKALASVYCISEKAIKQKLFLYKDKVGIKNEHFSLRNYIENF